MSSEVDRRLLWRAILRDRTRPDRSALPIESRSSLWPAKAAVAERSPPAVRGLGSLVPFLVVRRTVRARSFKPVHGMLCTIEAAIDDGSRRSPAAAHRAGWKKRLHRDTVHSCMAGTPRTHIADGRRSAARSILPHVQSGRRRLPKGSNRVSFVIVAFCPPSDTRSNGRARSREGAGALRPGRHADG